MVEEIKNGDVADAEAPGSPREKAVMGDEDALESLESMVDDGLEGGSVDADDEEVTEDQEDESEDESEDDSEDDEDGEDEDANADVQRVPYERLKKEVGKRKAAEETAAALKTRLEQLESVAGESMGLHPDYLSKAEAALLKQADELEQREEFLFVNLDGYEKDGKSMSADEVRKELIKVRRAVAGVSGRAQALYDERKAQMIEDMRRGRELRAKVSKKKPEAGEPVKKKRPVITPVSSGSSTLRRKSGKFNEKDFEGLGGGDAAALKAFESML